MQKDFEKWNKLKQSIEVHNRSVFANQREIWWCSVGINIGSESCGKNNLFERPVIVLKVINKEMVLVAPLSTKLKKNKYHVELDVPKGKSYVQLEHVKSMSVKRLTRKVSRVPKDVFEKVITEYRSLI
jgi:mRNA interferase MazF